jgi:hypothetical protein
MIVVLQVSADGTSDATLELNTLFRALQEIGKPRAVPIVETQEVLEAQVELVARGGRGP